MAVLVSCLPSSNDSKLSNILHPDKAQFVLIFLSAFSYQVVLCPSFHRSFSKGNLPKVKPTSQFVSRLPADLWLLVLLFSWLILVEMEPSPTMKNLQTFLPTLSNGSFWSLSVWNTRRLAEQAVFVVECLTQLGWGQSHIPGNLAPAELWNFLIKEMRGDKALTSTYAQLTNSGSSFFLQEN